MMGTRLLMQLAVASLTMLIASSISADLPRYRMVSMDFPGCGANAAALNNHGDVVGACYIGWPEGCLTRAFIWHDGIVEELGSLEDNAASASDINDRREVVGIVYGSTAAHAFLWQNGVAADLGNLPGGRYSSATAINNRGQVVGYARNADGALRATLWQYGVMMDLGTLPGFRSSLAKDINDSGQIVGMTGDGYTRGFLWENGQMTEIGMLPGDQYSGTYHINDEGAITGHSGGGTTRSSRGFVWTRGNMTGLGEAELTVMGNFYAINNAGSIVGPAWVNGTYGPALYQNGIWTLLSDLVGATPGCQMADACDINERGQIAGNVRRDGIRQPFVLTPITQVQIDIMPGNRNNPINPGSNGVTSVAILGSAGFDASQVDPSTVTLAGAHVSPRYRPSLRDVNRDHILDIVLQVITREMQISRGVTSAVLEGELMDGTLIGGEDAIRVTVGR